MENNLKLEVGLKFNDSEAEQGFRNIQQKLKSLSSMTGSDLSPAAQQQQQGQNRIMQDMQKRYVEDLNKQYQQIQNTMGQIDKLYSNQMMQEKSRVAMQEKLLQLKQQEKQITETMARAGVTPAGQQPPPPPQTPSSEAADAPNQLKSLIKGFLTAGAASAIIRGALNISQNIIQAEGRELRTEGSAINAASSSVRDAYSGRGFESVMFGQERLRALEMADTQRSRQSNQDMANIFGRVATGALMGGVAGGMKGSVAGLPGMIAGGALGALGGFGMAMTDDRSMAKVFDNERYEKMLTAEGMQNFQAYEAAERAKNPFKTLAADFTKQRGRELMNLQRSTGLTDQTMFPMLEENMGFGGGNYSLEEILKNQSGMAQAGASSEDLRGNLSGMAASAQQYGITNAASVMGRISGAGNQQGSTDDAFARLLTVAVKNGVDLSTMPQELNRFANIAVDIATKGGGFSQEAAERFAAGITDMSATSMQGARTFADQFQGNAGMAGGLEGQIGMGFLLGSGARDIIGDEASGRMKSGRLTSVINTLTVDELEKNPVLSKGYAAQLGIDEQQLIDLVAKKDLAKNTRTTRQQEALSRLGGGIGDLQGDDLQAYLEGDEGSQLFTEAFTSLRLARGESFRADATGRATVTGLARMAAGGRTIGEQDIQQMMGQIGTPKEGVLEDVQRSRAVGDQMQLGNLQDFFGEIGKSASSFKENSAKYEAALQVFIESAKEGGEAMSQFKNEMKSALEMIKSAVPQDPSMPTRVQPRTGASGGF